jgi:hypothetical protein
MPNGAFDRGDQEPGGVGLTHTAEGAGVLCLARDLWIFVKRSDDDGNLRSSPHNFTGRFEAVATGHNDVHDDDVRMQSSGSFHGFVAIGGFAANLKAVFGLEKMAQEAPYHLMIIHHENANMVHVEGSAITVAQ